MSKRNDRNPEHREGKLPHLLRIEELAQRLGVSVRHLRRLVQERRIPSLKVGHFVMFDESEIVAWLEHCRRPAEGSQRPA
jgi:excisionase family DNA binding protein